MVALAMIAIVITVLFLVNKKFDKNVGYVIEGVSKVVAAIFILQLSYKLPKWLGVYAAPKKDYNSKVIFVLSKEFILLQAMQSCLLTVR